MFVKSLLRLHIDVILAFPPPPSSTGSLKVPSIAALLSSHLCMLTQGVHLRSSFCSLPLSPNTADMVQHTPAANNRGLIHGGHAADLGGPLSETVILTWVAAMEKTTRLLRVT